MGLANCATGKTRSNREECAGGHHTCLFDHLVGDLLEMRRHVDAQRSAVLILIISSYFVGCCTGNKNSILSEWLADAGRRPKTRMVRTPYGVDGKVDIDQRLYPPTL